MTQRKFSQRNSRGTPRGNPKKSQSRHSGPAQKSAARQSEPEKPGSGQQKRTQKRPQKRPQGSRPGASPREEAPARQPSTAPRRNPATARPLDLPRPEDHPPARPADRRPDRRPERQGDRHVDRQGGANQLWLYGHHAVAAALGNPKRRVLALTATDDSAAELERIRQDAGRDLPPIETLARETLEARLPAGAPHQGLAIRCAPLPELALADLLAELDPAAPAVLVGLDQVTDPQNAGAVLRSAAAFGAHGVILTERHAAPETGTLARAASGALDVVPLVRVGNLARAIDELKEAGFWIFGLAGDAASTLGETELPARIVLMLGAEGSGLRRLTRERCDGLIRLPTRPPIDQLNVSNAAAIALYEANRRRL